MIQSIIPWKDPNKDVPKTNGIISEPLVYMVNGKALAGHYHINGCYYRDTSGDSEEWLSRPSGDAEYNSFFGDRHKAAICQRWAYLSEIQMPTQDTAEGAEK